MQDIAVDLYLQVLAVEEALGVCQGASLSWMALCTAISAHRWTKQRLRFKRPSLSTRHTQQPRALGGNKSASPSGVPRRFALTNQMMVPTASETSDTSKATSSSVSASMGPRWHPSPCYEAFPPKPEPRGSKPSKAMRPTNTAMDLISDAGWSLYTMPSTITACDGPPCLASAAHPRCLEFNGTEGEYVPHLSHHRYELLAGKDRKGTAHGVL
ncbi:hypothetical protein ColTof3_04088 [Colletotrichum tofieldiae]|nr:hypothetical protein ColTof3_04088 [Colletotrichum tofieldiae]